MRTSDFVAGVKSFVVISEELFVQLLVNSVKVVLRLLLLDHSSRVTGIRIGTTSPGCLWRAVSRFGDKIVKQPETYLAEADAGIDFDAAMEPTEEDGNRP